MACVPYFQDMATGNVPEMLRAVEEEASILSQMHRNISDGLSRLEIKVEVFLRVLQKLGIVQANSAEKVGASSEMVTEQKATFAEENEDLRKSRDDEIDEGETSQCVTEPTYHANRGLEKKHSNHA